jgi:hypothetical protein
MGKEIIVSATRFNRAVALLLDDRVVPHSSPGYFLVTGSDDLPYVTYVSPEKHTCTCPWGQHAPTDWTNPCAHSLAAASLGEVEIPDFVVPVSS